MSRDGRRSLRRRPELTVRTTPAAGRDQTTRVIGMVPAPEAESVQGRVHPALADLVLDYSGSRLAGFEPGEHLGTPGLGLPLILSLRDHPMTMATADQETADYPAIVSGLHLSPVMIAHASSAHTLTVMLSPAGVRTLLGVPARALFGRVVRPEDVLGPAAHRLRERVEDESGWAERFRLVEHFLLAKLPDRRTGPTELHTAWGMIRAGQGRIPVAGVAARLGWGRRRLHREFVEELGLGPKAASRVARFGHSRDLVHRKLLGRRRDPTLAQIAVQCGYSDEAHMAREWRTLTSTPPGRWRNRDEFSFFQDDETDGPGAHSSKL